MSAVIGLCVLAVLLWPGRALPARGLTRAPREAGRPRRPGPDAAATAESFAAALESGLGARDATAWCAGETLRPDEDPVDRWLELAPAVGRALAVSTRLGSPAATAVRAAADAERDRAQVERDLRAGLSGVRATAWLLTALPVGGALLALGSGASSRPALTLGCLGVGALATSAGWLVLRRLVGRARRQALA